MLKKLRKKGKKMKNEKEKRLVLDVGYTDRKKYKRKEGVEVEVEKNQIGRKRKGKRKKERKVANKC